MLIWDHFFGPARGWGAQLCIRNELSPPAKPLGTSRALHEPPERSTSLRSVPHASRGAPQASRTAPQASRKAFRKPPERSTSIQSAPRVSRTLQELPARSTNHQVLQELPERCTSSQGAPGASRASKSFNFRPINALTEHSKHGAIKKRRFTTF